MYCFKIKFILNSFSIVFKAVFVFRERLRKDSEGRES